MVRTTQCVPPETWRFSGPETPELALAIYKFKNLSSARENPKYRRSVPKILDEAIKKGSRRDEVLFFY